ncbi:MAG TPA: hypothetical protein VEI82_00655 [Myxococcota bacterium]|nr:hypothetical protein [Myxococcota bacterium]
MIPIRTLCLSLVLLAPLCAAAQSSSDIVIDTPETLQFRLRMSIAPGTQQVYCYQQDRMQVVGSVNVSSGSTAYVPVVLPDPIIRCSACNAYGCSSLSPNAAVLVGADPLDIDHNGKVDVSDMLTCMQRIRDQIY